MTQPLRVERAGWVWHLCPAGVELFGQAGPDPGRWPVTVVKQNLQRTVCRAVVDGVGVFVKRCRPNTPRAWLRELVRSPKARLECENAVALAARGVPTLHALGWGRPKGRWPAESVLLTREAAGEPLTDALLRPLPPAARRTAARRLARFVASLHDAGVSHPDPHPGNLLVGPDGELRLIDLHAVRLGRPLPLPATLPNLVLFNRFFQLRATTADRLRFWRAYLSARPPGALVVCDRDADVVATLIERMTAASNRRFWAARVKRHLGDNRDTHRVTGPTARGWAARDLPADIVAGWLRDPDGPFHTTGAVVVKDSRTSTVARVDTPAGPVAYKRFNLKSPLLPLKALVRPTPAVRSWLAGHALLDRDLPTARPLACFQRHRFGLPTVGYLVCEWVGGAAELPVAAATLPPSHRRELGRRLGRLLRLMNERGVRHRDFKAANVLVADGRPVLVDLVGMHTGRDRSDREVTRLARSLLDAPAVSHADRLRVLVGLLGRRRAAAGGWKPVWRRLAAGVRVGSQRL